ncbi:unnamed protein product [Phytophthora lilii]|uniref:Unnamed protein product n=1 Tax=Phytophthora lilii TaxID=2077276 RepID=A0A9W6WTV3_9STRA|nr:unnamed protein product [Phytophthora lilii]
MAKSTTATYTDQFLRRKRSQQDLTDSTMDQQLSPRTNGRRSVARRRSSVDSDTTTEQLNGAKVQDNVLQQPAEKMENGHHAPVADLPVDEKMQLTSTDLIDDAAPSSVAGASEKGIATMNGGRSEIHGRENIFEQDQVVSTKVAMTKKRKAPCGRCAVVLAVAAGIATVSVASGIVICQMYPSSSVAVATQLATDRTQETLYLLVQTLRNEARLYTMEFKGVLCAQWQVLLSDKRLEKLARAADVLVHQKLDVSLWMKKMSPVTSISPQQVEVTLDQLRLAISGLADVLYLAVNWIQSHLESMGLDTGSRSEFVDRARAFSQIAFRSLMKALEKSSQRAKSSMDDAFEWIGLKSDVSDANLPSKQLLAPLESDQVAIQNIGKALTAQEARALQDVKRLENRRVAIAAAINSIISDTRTIAQESVDDAKMAAMAVIEERIKQLADQCAQSIEKELQEYEKTSRQVEEESGSSMLADITMEIQSKVDAAVRLKRDLTLCDKVDNRNLNEVPVLGDQTISVDDSQKEHGREYHEPMVTSLPEDEEVTNQPSRPLNELSETAADGQLDEVVRELAKEGILEIDVTEGPTIKLPISPAEIMSNDVSTQSIPKSSEKNQLVEQAGGSVVQELSSSVTVLDAGKVQEHIVAGMAEEDSLTVEVHARDNEEIVQDEAKQTIITEVVVELEDIVLEMEHTQMDVKKLYEAENLSASEAMQEVMLQKEEHVEAHLSFSVEKAKMEVVEINTLTAENTKLVHVQPGASTRAAITSKSNVLNDDEMNALQQMKELTHDGREGEEMPEKGSGIETINEQDSETLSKDELFVEKEEVAIVGLALETSNAAQSTGEYFEVETGQIMTDHEVRGIELEEDVGVSVSREIETLETQQVAITKEIEELEQLEQVLLQEEDERIRAEEDLRVIAKKEEIWLQSDQDSAEGDVLDGSFVHDRAVETTFVEKVAAVDTNHKSGESAPQAVLPGPDLLQISLLSAVFLVVAVLAAYLLARHRKLWLLPCPPRRRKRWQRLAELDESDAEEVVLLPDDSSDDEEDEGAAIIKSSLEAIELLSSVDASVLVSEEEDVNEDQEDVEGEIVDVDQEDNVDTFDTTTSQTVVVESIQTTIATRTKNHLATTDSVASTINAAYSSDDDVDSTGAAGTTPPASREKTPDTSQRARRRHLELRT